MTNRLGVATEASLIARIDELQRQIDELRSANNLFGSIPLGLSIKAKDPTDGSTLVQLGQNDAGTVGSFFYDQDARLLCWIGQAGVVIYDTTGNVIAQFDKSIVQLGRTSSTALWWDPDAGLVAPYEQIPMVPLQTEYVTVTSSTFTETHRAQIEYQQCKYVKLPVIVTVDAGTVAEFRLTVSGVGSSTAQQLAVSGGVNLFWEPPVTVAAGPYVYILEARRVSGAGNVYIFQPTGLTQGNYEAQSSTAGNWAPI